MEVLYNTEPTPPPTQAGGEILIFKQIKGIKSKRE
jgi:hypothetical protein